MRLVLAIALLAASVVSANAAEDRYGPRQAAAPVASALTSPAGQPYAGSMLGWSGKSAAPAPQTAQPAAPVRPALMAGGLYRSAPPPQAPAPTAAPAPTSYASAAPTSLYSRPTSQPPVAQLPPPPSPTTVQGGL
ncbi:MAG: hypothetical protein HY859_12275, partial [Caulobacterales bacterium]|nr:hypothetical protein [Caulobacterales bacterium]